MSNLIVKEENIKMEESYDTYISLLSKTDNKLLNVIYDNNPLNVIYDNSPLITFNDFLYELFTNKSSHIKIRELLKEKNIIEKYEKKKYETSDKSL